MPLVGVQVNQLVALLLAVQPHPALAVTVAEPVLAAALGVALVGDSENVPVPAACVTVNV